MTALADYITARGNARQHIAKVSGLTLYKDSHPNNEAARLYMDAAAVEAELAKAAAMIIASGQVV